MLVNYSGIHGYGLFAKVDIPNHSLIIGQSGWLNYLSAWSD